jgi:ParB-like nuclease domain
MRTSGVNAQATGQAAATNLPSIEWLPLRAFHPNPRNPRTHSKKQIRQIGASIRKFGFLSPVIVDEDNTILSGHGRLEAARLEGLTQLPTVCFDHLTAAQKRAFLIADNRIAEQAGWNREMLAIELGELVDLLPNEGLDVSVTGFETTEIDLLLADMAASRNEPPEAIPPLPRNAVTEPGDLWLLGKHRLLCSDAQEPKQFARLMNGALASAVFCDPPYNLRISAIGGRGRNKHPEFAFASGEMQPQRFQRFLSKILANGIRVSARGAIHFVHIDHPNRIALVNEIIEAFGQ